MQSNSNINNIHNEPPPSYHEVIATNKQKEIFTYKSIKSFNDCDKIDNENTSAIISPTSNTSSTYEFNQSDNLNNNQNSNTMNVNGAASPTSSCSDSIMCECTTTINQHFIANFCENCNNLYTNNNSTALSTCGQQNCFQNHFAYCMDTTDQINNNNIIDDPNCCLEQNQTRQTDEHALDTNRCNTNNNAITNSNNDENGNETQSINLNCNGLVRLDMTQIMDHTGLPTYDAAMKLEASGYV